MVSLKRRIRDVRRLDDDGYLNSVHSGNQDQGGEDKGVGDIVAPLKTLYVSCRPEERALQGHELLIRDDGVVIVPGLQMPDRKDERFEVAELGVIL